MTTVPQRLNRAPKAAATRVAAWLTAFPAAQPFSSSQNSRRSVIRIRSTHSAPTSGTYQHWWRDGSSWHPGPTI